MPSRHERQSLLRHEHRSLLRTQQFLDRLAPGYGAAAGRVFSSYGGIDGALRNPAALTALRACYPGPRNARFEDDARARSRATELQLLLGERRPRRLLDVGAADGRITAAVAAELGIAGAVAVDVRPQAEPRCPFVQIDGRTLPFPDKSFDLVTMFMAAHHFADAPRLLAEARRVLQPRGAVVLREHGGGDKMYYDAIHAFYAVVAGDEESPEQFAKAYAHGYAQYRDRGGWVRLAADAGFVLEAETPPRGSFDAMYLSFAAAAAAALTAAPAASGPPEPRGSLR